MKYLLYVIICCSPLYSALPPVPELAVQPSSSGSSGESVAVVPTLIERSPRREFGEQSLAKRQAFLDSHKQKVLAVNKGTGTILRRDSAVSEEVAIESRILEVKGVRRGSELAKVAEAYIKATQDKATPKT